MVFRFCGSAQSVPSASTYAICDICPARYRITQALEVEPGDLLFTRYNGNAALVGACAVVPAGTRGIDHPDKMIRVTVRALSPAFVAGAATVGKSREHIRKWTRSTAGQAGISGSDLKQMPLPVGPLNEQRRIVDALDSYLSRLDAATEGLKRVEANLKRYRAAVLKAAVEGHLVPTEVELAKKENCDYEPASDLLARILKQRRRQWESAELARMTANGQTPKNDKWMSKYEEPAAPDTSKLPDLPKGWCWACVDQIAFVGTGATPLRGKAEYWTGGTIPWVTSSSVNDRKITTYQERVSEAALRETNLTRYPSGTVLVAMYGEGKTRGRAAVLEFEATTNQALAALQLASDGEGIRPWLLLVLEHNYERMRRMSSGGVQPNLNLTLVRSIVVPLAPTAEQARISAEVDLSLSQEADLAQTVSTNLRRVSRLRQSVLEWAFKGKLVDQDPNDEPASLLLDRIHQERAAVATETKRPARVPARKIA